MPCLVGDSFGNKMAIDVVERNRAGVNCTCRKDKARITGRSRKALAGRDAAAATPPEIGATDDDLNGDSIVVVGRSDCRDVDVERRVLLRHVLPDCGHPIDFSLREVADIAVDGKGGDWITVAGQWPIRNMLRVELKSWIA